MRREVIMLIGPMELTVIGFILLFVLILPLTALIIVFMMLAKKRKKAKQLEQK